MVCDRTFVAMLLCYDAKVRDLSKGSQTCYDEHRKIILAMICDMKSTSNNLSDDQHIVTIILSLPKS